MYVPRFAVRQRITMMAYRLGAGPAVLVRPDGIVAWRHDGPAGDRATALAGAVGLSPGRGARAQAA
jgi:hypothetical protein